MSKALGNVKAVGRVVRRFFSSHVKDEQDHQKAAALWKNLSLYVALPSCVLVGINTYLAEKEHREHYKRPEFINYDHMRIINAPFPWGDGKHSALFNKKYVCTRDGWED